MTVLRALGTTLGVHLRESSLDSAEFERLWARCISDEAPAERIEARGSSFVSLTQQITKAFISARKGELLMLHAGAVANLETGAALAFVAPGGTGKSTLSKLLGQEFGYLTDETVAIDPSTLEILPYPKPVTWTPERGTPKTEHAPSEFELLEAPSNPVLTHLVVLRRTDGTEPS